MAHTEDPRNNNDQPGDLVLTDMLWESQSDGGDLAPADTRGSQNNGQPDIGSEGARLVQSLTRDLLRAQQDVITGLSRPASGVPTATGEGREILKVLRDMSRRLESLEELFAEPPATSDFSELKYEVDAREKNHISRLINAHKGPTETLSSMMGSDNQYMFNLPDTLQGIDNLPAPTLPLRPTRAGRPS
ncbi:hypothetical protein FGG08_007518 [Glutinoglossum americanum]|uniref:Uncharacterized protein n=1 Tax=Glutinoglossum americanum TaxID=1670608 RepID=A0A9P8HU04_9PEZI|nr:hypothetical protein FGG08_007518 [Glutinoglossum americanum]